MIYVLYMYFFAVGGNVATDVEFYEYPTMEACAKDRLIKSGESYVPVESVCVAEQSGAKNE